MLIDNLKGKQHRESTRKNYYSIWKLFNNFFLRLDVKPLNWENRLSLFVGYLIDNGKQSSTIKSYVSTIRAVLKIEGIKINEDVYLLNALTRACKLKNDRIRVRHPLQRSMLNVLLSALNSIFKDQPYLRILYQTLFVITHTGLFRIGEVTESSHVVKAKDVWIASNKKKLKFTLWSSKTHGLWEKPQVIKIKAADIDANLKKIGKNKKVWCLFGLMRKYLSVRNEALSQEEQFFVFSDNSPVTPEHFREVLDSCLIFAGYDPAVFTVHSMRSGKALDLLELGVSVETIKKLGRWKLNAVFTYLQYY